MKAIKIFVSIAVSFCMVFLSGINVCAMSEEDVSSPSAVLFEPKSGTLLYEKESQEQLPVTSLTKLMSLILVFEALESGKISLDDMVTASAHAASMHGAHIWLVEGESMSVDDLIKAMVVASANDASVAMAEYISGSEEEFVNEMNKKANELGLTDTVFKNCSGIDEEGHVSTAHDAAIMSTALMQYEQIFDYSGIWMDTIRGGETQIVNTNKLLKSYQGITGLLTGMSDTAGCCISATAQRGDMELVAVVLGASTNPTRVEDTEALLDYGFANFTSITPEIPEEEIVPVKVKAGMKQEVNTEVISGKGILTTKEKADLLESRVVLKEEVEAPVKKGDKLGEVIYTVGEDELCRYSITATEDVSEISFKEVFMLLLNCLIFA